MNKNLWLLIDVILPKSEVFFPIIALFIDGYALNVTRVLRKTGPVHSLYTGGLDVNK